MPGGGGQKKGRRPRGNPPRRGAGPPGKTFFGRSPALVQGPPLGVFFARRAWGAGKKRRLVLRFAEVHSGPVFPANGGPRPRPKMDHLPRSPGPPPQKRRPPPPRESFPRRSGREFQFFLRSEIRGKFSPRCFWPWGGRFCWGPD